MESLVQKVFEMSDSGEGEPVEAQHQEQAQYAQETACEIKKSLESTIQEEFGMDVKDASILIVGAGGAGNKLSL